MDSQIKMIVVYYKINLNSTGQKSKKINVNDPLSKFLENVSKEYSLPMEEMILSSQNIKLDPNKSFLQSDLKFKEKKVTFDIDLIKERLFFDDRFIYHHFKCKNCNQNYTRKKYDEIDYKSYLCNGCIKNMNPNKILKTITEEILISQQLEKDFKLYFSLQSDSTIIHQHLPIIFFERYKRSRSPYLSSTTIDWNQNLEIFAQRYLDKANNYTLQV